MNLGNKQQQLLNQLSINMEELNKTAKTMHYSQDRCKSFITKTQPSDTELESCEALTARFARTADILTQKVLTTIFLLLQETPRTFIDKCNLAEKIGIIKSASELMRIRELRNEIAHEYRTTDLIEMFVAISKNAENLSEITANINVYAQELIKELPINN